LRVVVGESDAVADLGLVTALIVQALISEPAAAFAVMAVTITLALPLTRRRRLTA